MNFDAKLKNPLNESLVMEFDAITAAEDTAAISPWRSSLDQNM
jgi:hypothetical protein